MNKYFKTILLLIVITSVSGAYFLRAAGAETNILPSQYLISDSTDLTASVEKKSSIKDVKVRKFDSTD